MQGFTLVELILVMVLVAILAAEVMPRLPDNTLNLSAQAEQLASDIRLAQSMAMTRGQRFGIKINANPTNTYQIVDQNGNGTVVHPVTGNTTAINLASTVATTNALVEFDGKGKPYTDVLTPPTALAGTATITLTKNGQARTVTVEVETGKVSIP